MPKGTIFRAHYSGGTSECGTVVLEVGSLSAVVVYGTQNDPAGGAGGGGTGGGGGGTVGGGGGGGGDGKICYDVYVQGVYVGFDCYVP